MRAVFTAEALNPEVKEAWHAVVGKDMPDTPRPPLAEGEVKFVGDPVALVVAESRYIAEDAVELVDVDYEPLPAVADFTKAANADVVVHEQYPDNVAFGLAGAPPDEETISAAAHVVSETIYQHMYVPVPMETRGIIVEWLVASREVTIWASTQIPHELRAFCARLLGLPAQHVRVIVRDTGGGFGQKVVPSREDMCIMLAARKVPAALKWIEDRRENLMSAGQARHVEAKERMAFDEDGNFARGRHRLSPGRGCVPDASSAESGGHRYVLPRPVPGSEGQLQLQGGVLQHQRSGGVSRAMAV